MAEKEVFMQELMNVKDIAFPHLGIYLENVPKNFSVFGFSIAFYGKPGTNLLANPIFYHAHFTL